MTCPQSNRECRTEQVSEPESPKSQANALTTVPSSSSEDRVLLGAFWRDRCSNSAYGSLQRTHTTEALRRPNHHMLEALMPQVAVALAGR